MQQCTCQPTAIPCAYSYLKQHMHKQHIETSFVSSRPHQQSGRHHQQSKTEARWCRARWQPMRDHATSCCPSKAISHQQQASKGVSPSCPSSSSPAFIRPLTRPTTPPNPLMRLADACPHLQQTNVPIIWYVLHIHTCT